MHPQSSTETTILEATDGEDWGNGGSHPAETARDPLAALGGNWGCGTRDLTHTHSDPLSSPTHLHGSSFFFQVISLP